MYKLGFLGAGKMTSAIVYGILAKNLLERSEIIATDINQDTRTKFFQEFNIQCIKNTQEFLAQSNTIILAVKPQNINELSSLQELFQNKLIISICAGITIEKLQKTFQTKIIRVMPNTPLQVLEGASAYSCSNDIDETEKELVKDIFKAAGKCFEVTEDKLDAITAISGSGPAYIFEFARCLSVAAQKLNLEENIAKELVAQTLFGASKMLQQAPLLAEEMRNNVTSPNGTTHHALTSFSQNNFEEIILQACTQAFLRSQELAKL